MRAAALILAVLMVAMPVADTGTGTAGEYDASSVTESVQATASVDPAEETETEDGGHLIRHDFVVPPSHQGEGLREQMDERGYLSVVGQNEINMLAYLVDMEIGSGTRIEKEAVVWCVLNRVDKGSAGGFRDTVHGVLTQSGQFRSYYGTGSSESYNIVVDVLTLWMMERQSGYPISGRVLPRDYCWYHGDGRHNHFRNAYSGGSYWDWSWTGGY